MSQHIPFDEILVTVSDPISRLPQKDMFPVEQDPKFVPEWWVVNPPRPLASGRVDPTVQPRILPILLTLLTIYQ